MENEEVNGMSEKIVKNVTCPKCSRQSEKEVLCSMNTKSNPEVRAMLMKDKLFAWKCPICGYQTQLLHPFLYNDIENRFMIYYIPKAAKRVIADEKLEAEFSDLSGIQKRVVPDVNTMKEKMILFQSGLNDMAMELAKLAVLRVVEKSTAQTVYEGYFLDTDHAENTVTFQFFIGPEKRPYIQTTRLEVYNRSLSIVQQYFADEQSGFLNIDLQWAREALKQYKNA